MTAKSNYLLALVICCFFSVSCQNNATNPTNTSFEVLNSKEFVFIPETDTNQYYFAWQESYDYHTALCNNVFPPEGYKRTTLVSNSFGDWLRHLPLNLKDNTVYLFSGEEKTNQSAQHAIINIDVGTKDLQQCADAVMRLRAEYLYATKQFDKITFNYTNGLKIPFKKWSEGYYPQLKGNKVVWINSSQNNGSYTSFRKYMNNIFTYAGTASLSKELKHVALKELAVGDVFIKGGFPGHAVIVVDVAFYPTTNDKLFLLAQSYMPAQSIHILNNPNNDTLSPWYSLSQVNQQLSTPEWFFSSDALMRFID